MLILLMARGSWRAFTAWSVAEPARPGAGADQRALLHRYRRAHDAASPFRRIGYVGRAHPMKTPDFLYARLALMPTLVVASADEPVLLADCRDDKALARALAQHPRYRVSWRTDDGMALLKAVQP